jgi:carbon-monoxide dehydrogenase iron sulfur subunit
MIQAHHIKIHKNVNTSDIKLNKGDHMRKVKLDKDKCVTCHTCEIACALKHSDSANIEDAYWEFPVPNSRLKIVMKKAKVKLQKCVHCKKPKCIEACEEGAITKQDDGVVVIDTSKCKGCWTCIEACPFDAIRKCEEENIAVKCDLCLDLEVPACVDSCHTQALLVEEGEAEA